MPNLDRYDRRILDYLQQDGRITNTDLAEKVGLSPSACLRRLNGLLESGLVSVIHAKLDARKSGFPGTAFLTLVLDRQSREDLDRFEAAVVKIPEVIECYLLAGPADYMLKIVYRDAEDLERLHTEELTKLPGVARVQSSLTLRCVKTTTSLPLGGQNW